MKLFQNVSCFTACEGSVNGANPNSQMSGRIMFGYFLFVESFVMDLGTIARDHVEEALFHSPHSSESYDEALSSINSRICTLSHMLFTALLGRHRCI